MKIYNPHKVSTIVILSLVTFLLSACGTDQKAVVPTVVIVNPLGVVLQDFVDGFTEAMVEEGYTDGKTITYAYADTPENMSPPAIEATIQSALTDKDVSMVVCVSTVACTVAKSVLAESKTPLLFMGVTDPISTGLVTDFTVTEYVTGIASGARDAANEGRAFEWLMQVAPETKKVFIPHNPNDNATNVKLKTVQTIADTLKVELVIFEVTEEVGPDSALTAIPDDTDAMITFSERIFTVPFMTQLSELAIQRKIPHLSFSTQFGQMMSYAPDTKAIGAQAAVLGGRILGGTAVSALPVEVPEFNLYINLPTIDAMGFEIDEQILRQAVVIRAEEGE